MSAQLGNAENVAIGSAYEVSFGRLPHDTMYQNPYGLNSKSVTVDMRAKGGMIHDAFMRGVEKKAQTISGQTALSGAAAGLPTVPVYLDPRIVDITRKYTPAVELIPRTTCNSNVYTYLRITAKGGAFVAAEDAALSETNTTYSRQSVSIKYLYAVGRVTGPLIAAQPSFILEGMTSVGGDRGAFGDQSAPNAKQQEVLVQARALRELEENLIFNGDVSSNPLQYDGIIATMSSTNTVAKAGAAITLEDLNTAVQNAFDDGGRPNVAFCSSAVFTSLLNLIEAKIGYLQANQTVFWGATNITYYSMVGPIPIIPSMYLSNTLSSRAIYFLDMSVVQMAVLQDMTFEELAKTNDSEKFMLKVYEALVIRAPTFCSSVTGIGSS